MTDTRTTLRDDSGAYLPLVPGRQEALMQLMLAEIEAAGAAINRIADNLDRIEKRLGGRRA